MASLPSTEVAFDLLDVLRSTPTSPIYYRIAVGSCIKYLILRRGPSGFPGVQRAYLEFNTVPVGDWDIATLDLDINGKFIINFTAKKQFPNATSIWHSSSIDLIELWRPDRLREDNDDEYTSQDLQLRGHIPSLVFPSPASLTGAKVAAFWTLNFEGEAHHGLARESHIYSLLRDTSIAPKFLAHLTENQERVIGYLMEYVPARAAGIDDFDLCRAALQKLHNLGIAHGHLTRDAFLIRQDTHMAQMRCFFSAYETSNQDILDEEMSRLGQVLQRPPPQVIEQLTAFWERGEWIHPVLFWQMEHEGRIRVSPEVHQAMLADLEKKDWICTAQDTEKDVERLRRNWGKWN